MILKGLVTEDFLNYKKCSLFLIFPNCSFKCDKENGTQVCQNWLLVQEPNLDIPVERIINDYFKNDLTEAVVCGGLEPFDSFDELYKFIRLFRDVSDDDIVIYTGYTEEELAASMYIAPLAKFGNIIIKYGRYRPNEQPHFDEILGVKLASSNQYAKRL